MIFGWEIDFGAIAMGFFLAVVVAYFLSSWLTPKAPPLPPRSIRVLERPLNPDRQFTVEELKKYDGSNPTSPIYLSCKGIVYDVTRGENFYGLDAPYSNFSGRDSSRAYGKVDTEEHAWHINDLTLSEKQSLNDWAESFDMKYYVAGKLIGYPFPQGYLPPYPVTYTEQILNPPKPNPVRPKPAFLDKPNTMPQTNGVAVLNSNEVVPPKPSPAVSTEASPAVSTELSEAESKPVTESQNTEQLSESQLPQAQRLPSVAADEVGSAAAVS